MGRVHSSPRKRIAPWVACLLLGWVWGGCESEPTKSQWVSSVVRKECAGLKGTEAQRCRIIVIKRFANVSIEEMKQQYPEPEPPDGPSWSLW